MAEVYQHVDKNRARSPQLPTAAPRSGRRGQEVLADRPLLEVPPATANTNVCAEKGCELELPVAEKRAQSRGLTTAGG